MEASSTAHARTPDLGVARRRVGEDVIKALLLLAALISVLTTTGIVISLLRETIVFFEDVGLGEFLFGTEWSPVIKPQSFGVLPLVGGTLPDHRDRAGWWPSRSGSARRSTSASTPARASARRSSRCSRCSAGVPTIVFGYFALTFFTPNILDRHRPPGRRRLQRAVRRDHHGLHGRADDRVGFRGRDVGGAGSRCARARSASAPPGSRPRRESCSRRRCRASSPRSCSAPRAPSARP